MADAKQIRILRQGPAAWNQWRRGHSHARVNLRRADLSGLNLAGVDLSSANLSHANLSQADLRGAELIGANLSHASLSATNLSGVDLDSADLSHARLEDANLSGAYMDATILAAVDVSRTIGLETVRHTGSSSVGLDTFFRSKGQIPEVFLRNAGACAVLFTYAGPMEIEPVQSRLGR